ncbi:MAG: potassium channel beta subunit family protein [Verrucomicrobiota bacterium]
MNYRRLGQSGLKVSELSLGSWVTFGAQVDVEQAADMMALAYENGVNFFDNAEAYADGQSETIMGQALRKLGWPRDSYCVSSKVFFGSAPQPLPTQKGLSRKHVTDACEQAIERLGAGYLDLYFCHRPDPDVPVEETVRAMDVLIRRGKVLYWGTSEWSAQQITEAHAAARQYNLTPPTMEQPQYNMFHRTRVEQEYDPLYHHFGLGTTIWSPLASGLLTGKYNDGIPQNSRLNLPGYEWLRERLLGESGKKQLAAIPKLAEIAQQLGLSMPRLAIAWCLKNPRVSTVILGASKRSQLEETLQAGADVEVLSSDAMEKIEAVLAAMSDN